MPGFPLANMFDEIITAYEIGTTLMTKREELQRRAKRLVNRITRGNIQVPIFGAGGSGKTTLGHHLAGSFSLGSPTRPYEESLNIEPYSLPGDIVCTMLVAPGQEDTRGHTWSDLEVKFASGKARGLINVVSYGFHAFDEYGYKETSYYRQGMSKAKFLEAYRHARRQEELQLIEHLVPHLRNTRGKLWMITLVNKQDLWWNDRNHVKDFYMNGAYNDYVQQILEGKGKTGFAHEYLSVSLAISNFYSGKGELLAKTTSGYDQNLQYHHAQKFVNALNGFIAWPKNA